MTEPTDCPTCGMSPEVVAQDRDRLHSQNLALLRKVGRLEAQLAEQRKDSDEYEAVERLFARWQGKLGHPKAKLGPGREKALLRALAMFDEMTVAAAIDGCAVKPFVGPHGRQSDESKGAERHDDLPLICRDETTVERFAGYVAECNGSNGAPSSRLRVERLAWGIWRANGGGNLAGVAHWLEVRPRWVQHAAEALRLAREGDGFVEAQRGWEPVSFPSAHPLELRNVLEAFAERDLDVTGSGAQFKGQCPLGDRHANGDRTPSVSVTEKADGRTLLNCFGCGAGHLELARALDLYRRANGDRASSSQIQLGVAA